MDKVSREIERKLELMERRIGEDPARFSEPPDPLPAPQGFGGYTGQFTQGHASSSGVGWIQPGAGYHTHTIHSHTHTIQGYGSNTNEIFWRGQA